MNSIIYHRAVKQGRMQGKAEAIKMIRRRIKVLKDLIKYNYKNLLSASAFECKVRISELEGMIDLIKGGER